MQNARASNKFQKFVTWINHNIHNIITTKGVPVRDENSSSIR